MSDLGDRVTTLETQISQLTEAVTGLTTVLTGGRLALKILCWIASVISALAVAFAWLSDHIRVN
jgi:hypothetical protein